MLANDGPDKNVLYITPPMCFTCENAHTLSVTLDEVITEVENGVNTTTAPTGQETLTGLELVKTSDILPLTSATLGPALQSMDHEDVDDDDEVDDREYPQRKRAKYDDVD